MNKGRPAQPVPMCVVQKAFGLPLLTRSRRIFSTVRLVWLTRIACSDWPRASGPRRPPLQYASFTNQTRHAPRNSTGRER